MWSLIRKGPLTVFPLTQEEQDLIDPTGRGRAHLASMKPGSPTPIPPELRKFSREGWLEWYLSIRNKVNLHPAYTAYDDAHLSKYGAQGAKFSLKEVEEQLTESYTLAARRVTISPALKLARDTLLRIIRTKVSEVGYPQPVYSGYQRTSAGLPTMDKKGSFLAETVAMQPWRHVVPDLPGQRNQRLKHRVIHMDSNCNVRYIESYLGGVRNWLVKNLPEFFGAWRNPTEWEYPLISKFLNDGRGVSVETDFKSCDHHTSWELISELVLPVYEVLTPNKVEFIRFASFVEELFIQPIFLGSYMMTGSHNLLSGQAITNDFETIYDAIQDICGISCARVDLGQVMTLNMGDDIALLIRKADVSTGRRVMDAVVEHATLAGHEFSIEKCRVATDTVQFCRRIHARDLGRVYYNAEGKPFKYGAYPGILTLNSIVNPERPQESGTINGIAAFLQRLDNLQGNPMASELIGGIVSRYQPTILVDSFDDLERATFYDWWARVYGTTWSPHDSFAVGIIKRLQLQSKFCK